MPSILGMTQTQKKGRPNRVGPASVHFEVLMTALELAGGDEERIEVVSYEEVLVH